MVTDSWTKVDWTVSVWKYSYLRSVMNSVMFRDAGDLHQKGNRKHHLRILKLNKVNYE